MFMKKSILRSKPVRLLVWVIVFLLAVLPVQPVRALPNGENVTHGDVSFYTVGGNMVVVQQSGSAIVNYNSFSIDSSESVRFVQPGSSAAILNRVTGGSGSTIAGDLLANGHVYLINPNGILFTSSAHVDVGALVASGLNMSDSDFLAGNMYFSGGGGSVINEGHLSGRRVYLVGGNVENHGSISAGSVVLAAGQESVLIDRVAGGEIRLVIDGNEDLANSATGRYDVAAVISNAQAEAQAQADQAGGVTAADDAAAQAGNELAQGGQLAGDLVLETAETDDGDIPIAQPEPMEAAPPDYSETAVMTNGLVYNWGTITATRGPDDEDGPEGSGGDVTLAGVRVGQYGEVHADGTTGDGGMVNILATQVIVMNSNGLVTANAGLNGHGGDVIVISEEGLYMQGGSRLEALGGTESGDGGYIETSGYMQMDLQGRTSTHAEHGESGTYYIDPPNFYIDDHGDREDCNFLGFDCDYTITFDEGLQRIVPIESPGYMDVDTMHDLMDDHGAMAIQTRGISGSGSGQIAVEDNINYNGIGGSGIFLLDAGGNLFINGNFTDSNGGGDSVDIYLLAEKQIQIDHTMTSQGGDIVVVSGRGQANGHTFLWGTLSSGGGDVTVATDNDAQILIYGGTISAGSGDIILAADTAVFQDGQLTGNRVTVAGTYVEQSGDINASADIVVQSDGGSINMSSSGSATSSGGDILYVSSYNTDVTGLNAPAGTVVVLGRTITDAGDSSVDVAGNRAMLLATNGSISGLELSVNTLAGYASSGGISLTEVSSGGGITIGVVPTVNITGAGATGSTFSTSIPAFTGLVATGSGNITLTAQNGTITINEQVIQANVGSITLTAQGAGSDVNINDTVYASNGMVKVSAADSVSQNATLATSKGGALVVDAAGGSITMSAGDIGFAGSGNIRYSAGQNITAQQLITSNGNISVIAGNSLTMNSNIISLTGGSIDMQATSGSITMKDGTLAVAGNGNARLYAGGNILVSSVIATQGNVSITSTGGSILDNGETHPDVVAHKVQYSAVNGGVGSSANQLEMGGTNIAATAGSGGIYLGVGNNVIIDTVGAINVNRVSTSGGSSALSGSSLTGYQTTGGGDIVTVNNGSFVVNAAVNGGGNANILLANSTGAVNNMTLNAAVSSGSGSITIAGGKAVTQNANGDITTTGGDVVVAAQAGNLTMANGALTTSGGGDIFYVSPSNITVGGLNAGAGQVSVAALTGDIIDGGDTHKDIVGTKALLVAPSGYVGTAANRIDTDMGTAAAYAGNGGIYLTEDNNVVFGTVNTNPIRIVGTDGLTTTTNVPQLSGLVATNGNIKVETVAGSITISGVVANIGSGDIVIDAKGGGSDVSVRSLVVAQNGDIDVRAADSIIQATNIIQAGVGYINVDANSGSITMTNRALTFNGNGNIRYDAGQNATVDSLITSNGYISVTAGNNINQNSNLITLATGTIDVDANSGSITMKDGAISLSGNDNIRYEAGQNVTVSSLIATQGDVSVIALNGSILDGGNAHPDVVAQKAQFNAPNGGIGVLGTNANALEIGVSNVAARAGNGGINLAMGGDVIIDTVSAITVKRVQANGSVSTVGGSTLTGLTTIDDGAIVALGNGTITVKQPVSANGTGNVLVANTTTSTVNDVVLNQTVSSGSGNITILGGNNVHQGTAGDVTTAGGDIAVIAKSGDVVMSNGALSASSGGNVFYLAETNLYVGGINAGTGQVSAVALLGDIIDNGDAHKDFIGSSVQLIAPSGNVGSVANRLDTSIDTLAGYAGNGGIHIHEDNDVIIGAVGPVTVDAVGPEGLVIPTNTPQLSGLIATNGEILVDTIAGSISVQASVYNLEDGDVVLDANGGGSDIHVDALVYTYNGNIIATAADSITQSTNVISGGVGYINFDAEAGSITMSNNSLTFTGDGNIRYDAAANITVDSLVTSNGYISVTAGNNINQNSNIITLAGGTIDVDANAGSIVMKDSALAVSADNIRYEAYSNIVLSSLISTQADVSVMANYGSITDAGESYPNVVASNVQFWAPRGSIGQVGAVAPTNDALEIGVTTVAAVSGNGGINLGAGGVDLTLGTVQPIVVSRVQADNTVMPIGGATLSGLTATGGGSIVVADLEAMTVDDIVQVEQGGNILLATQTGALNRITINTNIIAEAGSITIYGSEDIYQNIGGDIASDGGDIVVLSKGGPIVMQDGVRSITDGGNIGYITASNLFLAGLDAGTGQVAVVALKGSIFDNGDTYQNVVAHDVQFFALTGHVGSADNRIETDVDNLAALAQYGDVNITEDDDLIIGTVGPISLNGVFLDATIIATNTPAFTGVISTNGNVLVDTISGSISIEGVVASLSDGNVRIAANGGGSDLIILSPVVANNGNITLLAADSIVQTTNVIVQTFGSIDVEALAGEILMTDSGLSFANDGNISYQAFGDITMGSLISTQGSVSVASTLGSILDGGNSLPEIVAVSASLFATNGGIGVLGEGQEDPLEVGIGTVAAIAGEGGINMINGGDVTVGTVGTVTVQRILADGTTNIIAEPTLSGFTTRADGAIVFASIGSMTVNDAIAADGRGNVLLATATGTVNSVLYGAQATLNAPVSSSNGHITIVSGEALFQNTNGDISTFGGDVSAVTFDGPITMADGALTESHGGNVLYAANTNIFIGGIDAGTGTVALVALDGSIFDNGDTHTDVVAHAAQFISKNGGVGTTTNGIETTVDDLTAFAANGTVKITESDDVTIGSVGPVVVNVVGFDGTTSVTNTPVLSGIIASNGHILVDTVNGSITVTSAVVNIGAGNIWLDANGANSDVVLSNMILVVDGNTTITADDSIRQYEDVISAGNGSVDVEAFTGSLFMADGALAVANDGPIRYAAEGDVTLGGLITLSNTIVVISRSGSILDGGDAHKETLSPYVEFFAGDGVGSSTNQLDIITGFLAARGGPGGVNVENQGITLIDTVPEVVVERVTGDGSTLDITNAAVSDLVTTNNGGVALSTVNGTIVISDGLSPSNYVGIHVDGTGTICVVANGTNSSLVIDADVISGSGDISLIADKSVIVNSNATEISTGGRGAIALWADQDGDGSGDYLQLTGKIQTQSGNIYVAGENIKQYGGSIVTVFGNISLKAANKLQLSRKGKVMSYFGGIVMEAKSIKIDSKVKGGSVFVHATRKSITGKGSIVADQVSLNAKQDIGSAKDPFDVDAGTLAAVTDTGDIYLHELNSVRVGQVDQLLLRFGVPECAKGMPVAFAPTINGVDSAGFLQFDVEGDLSGNRVEAGGDALITVGGSVNGLALLQAGGNIDLVVGDNYEGGDITAGGDLTADIGGTLKFDEIAASTVDITAGTIYMSIVNARRLAEFDVSRNIFDEGSMITSPELIMEAGGDIGSDDPIQLNVGHIGLIKGGGDVAIVQNAAGGTPTVLIQAGGNLYIGVPNGGLVDDNGFADNIIAADATFDAEFMGTLDDPLEVVIEPGNLKVSSGGLARSDVEDGYIFVHLDGTIGDAGEHQIEYIGTEDIPGLIIFNDRVVGGPDDVLRRFHRADAFMKEAPVIDRPYGWLGHPIFVTMETPGMESWEIFMQFILRDLAEITADSDMPEDAGRTVRLGDTAMLWR
ncbi:MAG: filamentous hemagglutinin N-terminal domain-containing protein [bacterium]